ncbi:hypothetical protein [Labilithrix luteola]|nr:hypothetical protein [Labilithrix luteola]
MSNPILAALYVYEASKVDPPVPCPCATGQCCFSGLTCVPQ